MLPGPAGALEGLIHASAAGEPRSIAVLAHPLPTAGGTMHTKALFHAARALARIGCPVLRFNFRGVGLSAGTFDEGRGERDDFRAALDFMTARYSGVTRVWAAGMSFGAWVAMTAGAQDPRVLTLIGIAPPVNHYDFSPVVAAAKSTFLIHGEFDELVPVKEVRKFYGRLSEPKELVVIDSADHLFDGKVAEVGEAVEDLLQDYDG
jgi:alpha/beta superfamily hydrolase